MKKQLLEGLKVILVFAAHIIAASLVFCMIGTGALVVHWFSHWLASQGLDELILLGLKGIEWLIFACDFVATAAWSIMSTIHAARELKGK